MDELTRELELCEVIAASDAMNDARTTLEDAADEAGGGETWEAIRRHVFPLLAAEHGRLAGKYHALRGRGGKG